MKQHVATAMALALMVGALGLAVAPVAMASGNCNKNFDIPDSKPLLSRSLDEDDSEVGFEDVVSGTAEILHVELVEPGMNGQLTWTVFLDDAGCNEYTAGNCDQNNVLTTTNEVTCTLQAPEDRDYYVVFEAAGDDIEYKTWRTT